ncbi:hypothetical protein tinsulaeT_24320 [Thalassotalea insulae]|uniref:Solute-binding protein family 3/N-terminal domain-containing protein n=1 Tax=Thalassotalea insulae TaxID=2056778 RepID=A0ABQ6GT55_9GAMM|nr:transporter substrate-binding domain-containing protein [Thalassotalea insulae]GLX79092.1 hypothetical protein tinsulaeT_24320 [Thalassotalea insulae]
MRVLVSILLIGILTSPPSISCALTKTKPNIEFGTTNTPESLLFKQAHAILQHAFQQLGYQFTLKHLPNKRSLMFANNNNIDGIAFRIESLTSKYPNLIKVEEVLFSLEQFVFSRKPIEVNGWQSLSPYNIAYERGTYFIEQHKAVLPNLFPVGSSNQAFQMVFHERADLTITSAKTGQKILNQYQFLFNGAIQQQSPAIAQLNLYSYLHKKHQRLAKELAQQLRQMKANGEFDRIKNKVQ